MATNDASPGAQRRAALVALLEERARLLAPSNELIGRALRRCVRHELRAQKRGAVNVVEAPLEALEPGAGPQFTAATGLAAVPLAEDEDTRATALPGALPAAVPGGVPEGPPGAFRATVPAGSVPTAVASAPTISEDEPQLPTPVSVAPAAPGAPSVGSDSGSRSMTRTLEPGRQIGGYRIEAMIGVGGMGQVYRATQLSMNRLVALKVLAPRLTRNARFRDRFLREARAAGRLHHPNLIGVHDVNEADGLLYFSMELVEGTSIRDLIGELGGIDEDRALDIVRQTLDALRYAHERGIVHRDIKPDNLMLTRTGMVKVADLGLSRSDHPDDVGDEFTTQTGTMMGTPYYMPPEQGRDAHRADHRADIYATGATLYHMVCGKVPFDGESAVAILINASTQPLTWPEPGPTLPVRRLIAALMARKVADRPQSASDALAMLTHLRTGPLASTGATAADRPVGPPGRLTRSSARTRAARRRRPVAYGLFIVLGLAVLGAGAWWEYHAGPLRDLRRRVGELKAEHRFAAAIGEIEHARAGRVRDGAALARLLDEANQAWDGWAMQRAAATFAAGDTALAAGNPGDADRALDGIAEAWRSPRVRRELDAREQALEQARSRTPPAAADERRPFFQKRIDGWLTQVLAGRATVKDGVARLAASGSAAVPPLTVRDRAIVLPLEISVRFPPDAGADDRVQLVVGGHAVRFTSEGASLVGGGTLRALARREADGRVIVTLVRRGDAVEIHPREGDPSPLAVGSGGALMLDWMLGKGRTAELSVVAASRPPRRETPAPR